MNDLVRFVTNSLVAGLGAATGFQATLRATQNLNPYPMPHQLAALLESPLRRQYLEPGEVLGLYGIMAGMTVLDLGCGAGLFTVELARMVGEQGMVHAVDIQNPMLVKTRARVAGAGVHDQVQLHHCGAYDLSLPDDCVDVAVTISTLGEIPDKPAALSELRRVLRPGGRLGITEELLYSGYLLGGSVRRWVEEAGFQFLARTGSPVCYHMVYVNVK